MAQISVSVPCQGTYHKVILTERGALHFKNHAKNEIERHVSMIKLGGTTGCGCAVVLNKWRKFQIDGAANMNVPADLIPVRTLQVRNTPAWRGTMKLHRRRLARRGPEHAQNLAHHINMCMSEPYGHFSYHIAHAIGYELESRGYDVKILADFHAVETVGIVSVRDAGYPKIFLKMQSGRLKADIKYGEIEGKIVNLVRLSKAHVASGIQKVADEFHFHRWYNTKWKPSPPSVYQNVIRAGKNRPHSKYFEYDGVKITVQTEAFSVLAISSLLGRLAYLDGFCAKLLAASSHEGQPGRFQREDAT